MYLDKQTCSDTVDCLQVYLQKLNNWKDKDEQTKVNKSMYWLEIEGLHWSLSLPLHGINIKTQSFNATNWLIHNNAMSELLYTVFLNDYDCYWRLCVAWVIGGRKL